MQAGAGAELVGAATLAPSCGSPAPTLTSKGFPEPTTISLPSSRPTSTWLRSLVTATLRMGTFMGRGGAAGCSLEGQSAEGVTADGFAASTWLSLLSSLGGLRPHLKEG